MKVVYSPMYIWKLNGEFMATPVGIAATSEDTAIARMVNIMMSADKHETFKSQLAKFENGHFVSEGYSVVMWSPIRFELINDSLETVCRFFPAEYGIGLEGVGRALEAAEATQASAKRRGIELELAKVYFNINVED